MRRMMSWKCFIIGLAVIFYLQPLSAQTWSKTKRLTDNLGDSEAPAIATDSSNTIHLVFHDDTPDWTHDEIFYKRSTNGGTSWTTKRLTWNPDNSSFPAIFIDSSDNIHVVWHDESPGNFEIYYRKSTNGGTSWASAKRLTNNSGSSQNPDIAVDSSGNIFVVYNNYIPAQIEIYLKKSTNGGTSWTSKRLTWNLDNSRRPDIAIDSNDNIFVVWDDKSPSNTQLLFKKSTNSGTSWTSRQLTWNDNLTYSPDMIVDANDNIHVAWEDYPGAPEIFYKKSVYSGSSWSATKRLTWVDPPCFYPNIASDKDSRLHVAYSSGYYPNYDIFYKRSTDNGGTWTTKRLIWIPGTSDKPAIAVAPNNNIYVVWQDEKPGNMEIYFKKGTQ
jgi:hypothetical protein